MSKIIVKNTCIKITDYEFGSHPDLEKYFLMFNPTNHQYYYQGLFYDTENRTLYLPRGIDVYFVEKIMEQKAIVERNMSDEFDMYDDIMIKTLPRNDVQKEALRFTIGKEEYRDTATKSQLQLNLYTGKGKTYIAIATSAYLGIKSIIITSQSSWLTQWIDRIKQYTNVTDKEIYNIKGSGCIYRLLTKTPEEIRKIKYFAVTHSTLKSYGDTHGWDKITELFQYLRIGLKFYDEAHQNFDNMMKIDYYTNTYKNYYITATALRSNEFENNIYQLSFKNVLAIDLFDPETDPHTEYLSILYSSKPTPQQISSCKNQYGLDRNKYTNLIVTNDNFYMMLDILFEIIEENVGLYEKCLVYIGTNNAISEVYNWIIENHQEFRNNVGVYTSMVSEEEKQQALNKRLILSTTKSAGAAVDIDELKMTVVLAEPFKSEVLARQTLGRTRANNTMYIEIVDKSFHQIKRYYNYKKPIFDKYATRCTEVEIGDLELINRHARLESKKEKGKILYHDYESEVY